MCAAELTANQSSLAELDAATAASSGNAGKSAGAGFSIMPFITHPKCLMGLGAMLVAIYLMTNDFPTKWQSYNDQVQQVEDKKQAKQQLLDRLQQIQTASKTIEPTPYTIYTLQENESPEIASLRIAQMVVDLSKQTGNTYLQLIPKETLPIDYSQVIKIPLQGDSPAAPTADNAAGSTQPNQSSQAAAAPTAPATNQTTTGATAANGINTPGPGATAATTTNPHTTIQASLYLVKVKGNLRSLMQFVHQLTQQQNLIFIQKAYLTTSANDENGGSGNGTTISTPGISAPSKAGNTKQLVLELSFLVPWKKP